MNWPSVLLTIASIPAVGGWIVAAVSGIQLFGLLPQGQRMDGYSDLSMWRFDKLRQRIGPAAEPLLKRMKWGGIVFALSVLVIIVTGALTIAFSGSPAPQAAAITPMFQTPSVLES
jgi:hypothetical protein